MNNILMFILFSSIALSYAWGMRGTIIGGEKGAMLPGAFMGIIISLFSGSKFLMSNPFLLGGIGAMAMYCGGNMTYADTLSLSMDKKPAENMKKGLLGVIIKGGIWFGIYGGFTGLFLSVLSGDFTVKQVLLFFALLPAAALIGYFLLNKPFDKENNRRPKIYFSKNRKETWGGLLGILIEIIVFAAVIKDYSTLALTLGTVLSGSLSWLVAQIFQIKLKHPTKKGNIIMGKANEYGFIDTWKVMECTLGALAGIGTALTFILSKSLLEPKFKAIDLSAHTSLINKTVATALVVVYIFVLFADTMQYFAVPAINKRYNKRLLKLSLISQEDYEKNIYENASDNIHFKRYKMLCEGCEFGVYSTFPLLLCFLGAYEVAAITVFPVVMLVLCQEVSEQCFMRNHGNTFWKLIFFIPVLVITILITATEKAISINLTFLMYTYFYEAVFFILKLLKNEKINIGKSERTVHSYFVLCCIAINILLLIL